MKKELTQQQIENLLIAFNELLKQQKEIAEKLTAIKDTLKSHADFLGMENGAYFMGDTLKSRYDNIWKDKFDSSKLKKDNIDLYNKYIKVGATHQITVNNPQII